MCGINGFYSQSRSPEAILDSLRRMNAKLAHRGPDAGAEFMHDNFGLGHRRLSILDLRPQANQPMFSQDNRYSLVFNGEIYNFQDLKEALMAKGHSFKTTSDTEVLLAACSEWEEEAFAKLNGIFSFAFHDRLKKTIYLVRDRFGIKPLFYSYQDGELGLSSSLAAILELPFVARNLQEDNLFHYLKHGHVPWPHTLVKGVFQLPPRSFALLNTQNGELKIKEYIGLKHKNVLQITNWEEALLATDTALKNSVKRQLIADVPVGIFLSGGVDSSLITAAFKEVSGQKINSYCISYAEKEFDEGQHALQVAQHFGTNHHTITVAPDQIFNLIPTLPDFFDQPFSDPTLLSTMILCREARKDITVALGGDGGDELFFGYTYQPMLLKILPLLRLPYGLRKNLAKMFKGILNSQFYLSRHPRIQQAKKFLDIMTFENIEELYMYFIGTIGPLPMEQIKRLLKNPPQDHTSIYRGYLKNHQDLSNFESVEQLFIDTFLVDTVNQKSDRASMAFGLELRVPFLDDEMVALSHKIPTHFKYYKGVKKHLLRELLQQKIPGHLAHRPKQGFSIPMRDWLRKDLVYLLKDYLSEERLAKDPYLSSTEVNSLVNQHLSGKFNHSHLLWSLIVLQLWRERFQL